MKDKHALEVGRLANHLLTDLEQLLGVHISNDGVENQALQLIFEAFDEAVRIDRKP